MLRSIFGPKRDKVKGKLRKVDNEELNDLKCSSNIFRVIKSRSLKSAGYVSRKGEERLIQGFGGET